MIPTPPASASLRGILIVLYYKSPNRDCSDRPILLRFDIPILLRRRPPRRLCDVDDDDLFLDDFAFVNDRTAFCNRLTLGAFLLTIDFSADFTFVFAALFALAVPCRSIWVPFLWIEDAILLPCFVASCFTSLLPFFATVCRPLDRISPIPEPTLRPPPWHPRRLRRRRPSPRVVRI